MVKVLIGLVAATVMSVSAGFASAAQGPSQADLTGYGYTKEQCKHGGWAELGFRSRGECNRFFKKPKPHEACKHGGWRDLGFSSESDCVRNYHGDGTS